MEEAQKLAWEWLLPNEQYSLYLTLGTGKSHWEVGEILKLSHYKYLELKERSEHLFKLFTLFLETYPSLFRPDGPCQESFKDYMEAMICRRTNKAKANSDSGWYGKKRAFGNKIIHNNMKRLEQSDNEWDQATLKLIFEFDRWNNFRILPTMLQQPSAYRRRQNKKHKIYIKYILNPKKMPDWLVTRLQEKFYSRVVKNREEDRYWIALINRRTYVNGYIVVPIRKSKEVVDELTRFYIYVFPSKELADMFGLKVANYKIQTTRIQSSQLYWPEFREIVKKAINYDAIQNSTIEVRQLDYAYNHI